MLEPSFRFLEQFEDLLNILTSLIFTEGEFLVMHLSELVRMAFIAGTSNNDQLKLAGIKTLFVSFESFNH